MCIAFLVILVGASVGFSLLSKYLVASKTLRLPLEREAYIHFNKLISWGAIPGITLLFLVPFVIIPMLKGRSCVSAEALLLMGLGVGVLFGLSSILYVCPRCGKFLAPPIKGARDALYHLTVAECPACKFRLSPPKSSDK